MILEQKSYSVDFGLHHDCATELEGKKARVTLQGWKFFCLSQATGPSFASFAMEEKVA